MCVYWVLRSGYKSALKRGCEASVLTPPSRNNDKEEAFREIFRQDTAGKSFSAVPVVMEIWNRGGCIASSSASLTRPTAEIATPRRTRASSSSSRCGRKTVNTGMKNRKTLLVSLWLLTGLSRRKLSLLGKYDVARRPVSWERMSISC